MCSYSLLAHNASGYLIQCQECGHFQFAFGTIEIVMDKEELNEFYNRLNLQKYPLGEGALLRKTIRIGVVDGKVALALTPYETKELINMIDEARASIEVKYLLHHIS